ncbi:hypothetical protein PIB30_072122, partial [Stylosanthes scabra]|nr:hypothetical protein [Stylosanthes scabra]
MDAVVAGNSASVAGVSKERDRGREGGSKRERRDATGRGIRFRRPCNSDRLPFLRRDSTVAVDGGGVADGDSSVAYKANVIWPNKHQSEPEKFYKNHLLESETYIGGHVECLESCVFRSDIPTSFTPESSAYE